MTTVEGPDWREETPVWSMVSTAPEDFGITYDDLTDLDGYPLDKLAAYCLGADGVFAEDGFDQLYCRFVEAPRTWVTYVSLLPEEEQKILCEHTALAAASWYADSNEFLKTWMSWRQRIHLGQNKLWFRGSEANTKTPQYEWLGPGAGISLRPAGEVPAERAAQCAAPTAETGPGALARQSQAQFLNHTSFNFYKPRAQWPGGNSDQPLRFCAPEMLQNPAGTRPP